MEKKNDAELKELIETCVREMLEDIKIGNYYFAEFALYQKTGEKELTLLVRFHHRHPVDTNNCLRVLAAIIKEIGWVLIISKDVEDLDIEKQKVIH